MSIWWLSTTLDMATLAILSNRLLMPFSALIQIWHPVITKVLMFIECHVSVYKSINKINFGVSYELWPYNDSQNSSNLSCGIYDIFHFHVTIVDVWTCIFHNIMLVAVLNFGWFFTEMTIFNSFQVGLICCGVKILLQEFSFCSCDYVVTFVGFVPSDIMTLTCFFSILA